MKVNSPNDPALAAAATPAKAGRSAAAAAPSTSGGDATASGVPLSVSASARVLDAASAGSGIDSAKVAAMRAAIADGTFSVNANAIADKLLANAQEFLSRARS